MCGVFIYFSCDWVFLLLEQNSLCCIFFKWRSQEDPEIYLKKKTFLSVQEIYRSSKCLLAIERDIWHDQIKNEWKWIKESSTSFQN